MFKKIILLLFISVLFVPCAKATHLMGGEITWECQSNGKYIFYMKIYRDCNGISFGFLSGINLTVSNNPAVTSIPMNYIFPSTDISPQCTQVTGSAVPFSCGTRQSDGTYSGNAGTGAGAVEELRFKSNQTTLAGVPNATNGWVFSYSPSGNRNNAITNLANPGGLGFTIRAKMFPYKVNNIPKNANPCYDSSPSFAERPSTIICKGYPFTYNHNANDSGGSLCKRWG